MALTLRQMSVAVALMLLTSALGLLTTASKVDGRYPYNSTTIPLFAECIKLGLSAYLLRRQKRLAARGTVDGSALEQPPRITVSASGATLFLFPSVLYFVHNNVQFFTLKYVDATTYQVLGSLKIVSTGLLFRVFLRQRLSMLQWIALLLLMIGTVTSQINTSCAKSTMLLHPAAGYLLGVLSAVLSALGAVYTEWVLKRNADSLHWQNMQLYSFGIVVNAIGVVLGGGLASTDVIAGGGDGVPRGLPGLTAGYTPLTWLIVANLAFSGLLVSWIMKYADSILKVYSTSMALLLSMAVSVALLDLQPTLQLVLGVITACCSLLLYYLPAAALQGKRSGTDGSSGGGGRGGAWWEWKDSKDKGDM